MTPLGEIDVPKDVLALARGGDERAQAHLYAALAPAIFGLIRRLVGSRAVAEDLFQDTMMTMYERLASFRCEAPLGAWVRQIAVSKCLMHFRSPWQRARIELSRLGEDGSPDGLPTLTTPAPRPEALDIERALAGLSATARAVVWLYEVEGYSHEEIARAFGRTVSFSKSQLSRAHRRLRERLESRAVQQPCTLS